MDRRTFIRNSALTTLALGALADGKSMVGTGGSQSGKRIGIIGLDTSHSLAFTKALNAEVPDEKLLGYKVVAAYPYGSKTIESSAKRIPGYIEEVRAQGVEIVDSIPALLDRVDAVLLETNDGRLHLEQALPVFKAGKRLFIDKPMAASLADVKAIFEASEQYRVPVFSSSSLRYIENIDAVKRGDIGKITGADAFSPATIEPTHPDLFWYGIHGVEILYAIMGTGCERLTRIYHEHTDIVVGTWADGRIGTFRGTRTGNHGYGGMVYGEKGHLALGKYGGYIPLLYKIITFFEDGIPPVDQAETLEIMAFMEAADESKKLGGKPVLLSDIMKRSS
ncbi:Gfo/Idh/MocA family protein [Parapedobacter sp. DT-150]|uniref:Gfo/Idh/MocA family protein n=1 Tax=Parapedobacter sp. DT-150 TaxID=3396162 RepID=UPI003F53E9C3